MTERIGEAGKVFSGDRGSGVSTLYYWFPMIQKEIDCEPKS